MDAGPAGDGELEFDADSAGEDQEEEARPARTPKNPLLPTKEEIDKHYVTHLPYRDWCPCCVAAKKSNPPHRRQDEQGHGEEGARRWAAG